MKFELERHPFFWLTQAIAARDSELAQGLREFGLRVPEWRALGWRVESGDTRHASGRP